MPPKKTAPSGLSEHGGIFQKTWVKIVGALGAIATIFSIGFVIGKFKEEFDSKVEKLQMGIDCAEKVQAAKDGCREEKMANYQRTVDDLKKVVSEFQKKPYEK